MKSLFVQGNNQRLLVFFHGTGGDEESLLFMRKLLDPDAAVLSFRGTWSENGKGTRFFKPLVNGQLNQEDFDQRLQDFLLEWSRLDLSAYETITLVGFSNGANFIMGLLSKGIQNVHQALLLHPSALVYSQPKWVRKLPIFVTAGRNDELVDLSALEELCQSWQRDSFERLELKIFKGGHFLTAEEKEEVIQWYKQKLPSRVD